MLKQILALVGLSFFTLSANAAFFSTEGLIDQSSTFSITVGGITMTMNNPSPGSLINFPDGANGLDFGDASSYVGSNYVLNSFDLSFDRTMSLTSLYNPISLGSVKYSITGDGVTSYGNILSDNPFIGGPLIFQTGESYTFTVTSSNGVGLISGFYASEVPIPAAAWLFGSALIGLAGIKRKK